MARVLFTTIGSWGDLFPVIGVGLEMRDRGHTVELAASPAWRDVVENAGLTFVPVGRRIGFDDFARNPEIFGPMPFALRTVLQRFLFDQIDELTADLEGPIERSDLVVSHPAHVAALNVAERLRVPSAVATVYGNRVYTAFDAHLRGAPPVAYDAECGAVIAASSRIAEPILGSAVRVVARSEQPGRVLDIGCGSGVYLRHILEVVPNASGVGVDLDAGALGVASEMLHELRSQGRCELRQGDIQELAGEIGTFDVVTLLNNIYYWPPAQRAATLRAIRAVVSPGALLLLATATTDGEAYNLHLDLMLRVTASSHRLPTRKEITVDLADAGFVDIETIEPVPKSGFLVATARNPAAS